MKTLQKLINKQLNIIIIVFLYLQPIIDVLTSVSINIWHLPISLGIIIRMIFLVLLVIMYLLSKNSSLKKNSFIYLGIIFSYIILVIINILITKDVSVLSYEMQNTIRTFYYPIMAILIYNLYQEKLSQKHLFNIMIMYMVLIIIPIVTKTSFDAYTQGKIGQVGWFNSTNEISAILSILFPGSLLYIMSFKNNYQNIIKKISFIILVLYTFFVLGTKMTIITLLITIFVFFSYYLVKYFRQKKYKLITIMFTPIILGLAIIMLLLPKTNFYKNIVIHLNYLEITNITQVFTKENFDHFIFSSRLKFLDQTKNNYDQADFKDQLLGIGYIENYSTDEVSTKMIEMDFFDIYFRQGKVGFIIFILPFFYFSSLALTNAKKHYQKSRKDINKLKSIVYYTNLFLVIFIATLVGHVLISPAVSIFVLMISISKINESRDQNE